MEFLSKAILILLLILLNGFFVASEYALVAVRKTRIEELVNRRKKGAKKVLSAKDHIDYYISATQLGITIVSLAVGWLGEPLLAGFFEGFLFFLPHTISIISSHVIGILLSFLLITFFHVVIGELVPKNIALQKSEQVALFTILPLMLFTKVFRAFIWVLQLAARSLLTLLGLSKASTHETVHSEEEVRMILAESEEEGAIPEDEVEMIENVFKLDDTPIVSIMVRKPHIIAFKTTTHIKDALQELLKSKKSRYPVYRDNIDTITGFVHVKDIYQHQLKDPEETLESARIIRKIISVTQNKRADDVLIAMQKNRVHMAVVVDKKGKTVGIVTLEDIIEGLVGEIEDEFEPS